MVDSEQLKRGIMKRIGLIALLVIAMGGSIMYCLFHDRSSISIVKDKSFFSDYCVEDGIVRIKCYITIRNTYNHEVMYKLVAKSQVDYEQGLLSESTLFAMDDGGNCLQYTIPPSSEKSFYVLFSGEYGGTNKKHDRLLPDIEIIVIHDSNGTGGASFPH